MAICLRQLITTYQRHNISLEAKKIAMLWTGSGAKPQKKFLALQLLNRHFEALISQMVNFHLTTKSDLQGT